MFVKSGLITVGKRQMARFLTSILLLALCSVILRGTKN